MLKLFLAFVAANLWDLISDISEGEVLLATVILAIYFEISDSREGGDKR